MSAFPITLSAFPISISAFPISLAAYPISLSAFPACTTPSNTATAQCHGEWRSDVAPNPDPAAPLYDISGYHPSDLQDAYGLTAAAVTQGANQLVAVVVAYHNPALQSDLNAYRAAFRLPQCTVANKCLTISILNGSNGTPAYNPAWSVEEVIDVEMVSATCPLCRILVVEAPDATLDHLSAAAWQAATLHANVVSNSYSVPETAQMQQYASHYQKQAVVMVAGAGDKGYGPGFPASFSTVTAVGGASLIKTSSGWFQAVWPGTGSGCSVMVKKPQWQTDTGCKNRTVNDLAVVSDPATGVAGYVSSVGGWSVFGGTSVGSPIVAGMYALAGKTTNIKDASSLYAHAATFNPLLVRANGTCSPSYLCTGGFGYTGPSGLGMPTSLSAFAGS